MAAENPLTRLSAVDITRTSFTCLRAQSPALAGSCDILWDQRERHRALRHVLEIVLVVLVPPTVGGMNAVPFTFCKLETKYREREKADHVQGRCEVRHSDGRKQVPTGRFVVILPPIVLPAISQLFH